MDIPNFNNELYLASLQFARVFTGITLSRKDKSGKNIIVPCVVGNRSRILKNRENPSLAPKIALPMIIVTRNGFSWDSSRSANLHLEKKLQPTSKSPLDPNKITPLPIDLNYTISILTKYPSDMDEILCNFLPRFNKDIYVRINHPKIVNYKLKSEIVWNGSVDENWPTDIDHFEADIQEASTSFIYKTYLFGGTDQYVIDYDNTNAEGIIKVIRLGWATDIQELVNKYGDASSFIDFSTLPPSAVSEDLYNKLEDIVSANGCTMLDGMVLINQYPNGIVSAWGDGSYFHNVPASMTFEDYFKKFENGEIPESYYDVFHSLYPTDVSAMDQA